MMKRVIQCVVLLMAMGFSGVTWSAEGQQLGEDLVNPGYHEKPDWFKTSFLDIREDIDEAASEERRIILYIYQDGCPYCAKLLQENFADQSISETTQKNFDVIAINMWGDRLVTNLQGDEVTEKDFVSGLKAMFTPTMLFLNEQGDVVLRINGYFPPHRFKAALNYVAGKHETRLRFAQWADQNTPAAAGNRLHDEPGFLKPPYRLRGKDRASQKPLVVMFEQTRCAACDELHQDVLQRPESQDLLKGLDAVVLDRRSQDYVVTPSGMMKRISDWAKELEVQYTPSLFFFDRGGDLVFRTGGYLRSFHVQSIMEYVQSESYKQESNFQRYLQERADALRAQGIEVDIMR